MLVIDAHGYYPFNTDYFNRYQNPLLDSPSSILLDNTSFSDMVREGGWKMLVTPGEIIWMLVIVLYIILMSHKRSE